MGAVAIAAPVVSCLVAKATTIESYSDRTTVPRNTAGDVALGKAVTLCDRMLAGGSASRLTDGVWRINGTVKQQVNAAFRKVYADDKLLNTDTQ